MIGLSLKELAQCTQLLGSISIYEAVAAATWTDLLTVKRESGRAIAASLCAEAAIGHAHRITGLRIIDAAENVLETHSLRIISDVALPVSNELQWFPFRCSVSPGCKVQVELTCAASGIEMSGRLLVLPDKTVAAEAEYLNVLDDPEIMAVASLEATLREVNRVWTGR